jgi:hypothetical protein
MKDNLAEFWFYAILILCQIVATIAFIARYLIVVPFVILIGIFIGFMIAEVNR